MKKNDIEDIFTEKYIHNHWKGSESLSGPGSTLEKNKKLLNIIENFIISNNIKTIIDCGCGDFNWMKHFNFNLIDKYVGIDIINFIIIDNISKYNTDKINFKHMNIIEEDINTFDLVLCKDVLFHLSFNDSILAINNFINSKSKYLISTTFVDYENIDIKNGDWRPINLESSPFLLGKPLFLWKNIENRNDKFVNKSVGVWKIN